MSTNISISRAAEKRPVNLLPHHVEALRSGRLRTLILPHTQGSLPRYGDALWVREAVTVRERQKVRHRLYLVYAGEGRGCHVPWPSALEKPPAGYRTADRMPINLSRFTLFVQSARCCRFAHVTDDEAIAAGVTMDGSGFGLIGYPFLRPFDRPIDALRYMLATEQAADAEEFPLAIISFMAVTRNISQLVLHDSGGRND